MNTLIPNYNNSTRVTRCIPRTSIYFLIIFNAQILSAQQFKSDGERIKAEQKRNEEIIRSCAPGMNWKTNPSFYQVDYSPDPAQELIAKEHIFYQVKSCVSLRTANSVADGETFGAKPKLDNNSIKRLPVNIKRDRI